MKESEQKQAKGKRRFSQEQYDMLKRCSKKKDMTEWNEWRKQNIGEAILLEGADFLGVNLSYVNFTDYGEIASPPQVRLRGASFMCANLEHGQFSLHPGVKRRAKYAAGKASGLGLV